MVHGTTSYNVWCKRYYFLSLFCFKRHFVKIFSVYPLNSNRPLNTSSNPALYYYSIYLYSDIYIDIYSFYHILCIIYIYHNNILSYVGVIVFNNVRERFKYKGHRYLHVRIAIFHTTHFHIIIIFNILFINDCCPIFKCFFNLIFTTNFMM